MDPILTAAFSIKALRGGYALLIGSGVSRAAQVPTGWEVIEDLIRRIATLRRVAPLPEDPESWYRDEFGDEPDYSGLLEKLAPTPSERQALLSTYFEASPEERESGIKVPTRAHRAIAKLVELGYIRVILTTNFDRLLEEALVELGIQPTVISSPDLAEGAPPLAHNRITVVKLHGDYLDTRIKNSHKELDTYDPRIDGLLDRIFDEYGFITSGWSGQWDPALRRALERRRNRRYSTFITIRGEPNPELQRVANHLGAQFITIKTADIFFDELCEALVALDEVDRRHPASTLVAVERLKRYLPEPRHRIRLHDLVMGETEVVRDQLRQDKLGTETPPNSEEIRRRALHYEASVETLETLFATGCFWDDSETGLWARTLRFVLDTSAERLGGYVVYSEMRLYPALRLLYAGGIAAVAARRFSRLRELLEDVVGIDAHTAERMPASQVLLPQSVDSSAWAQTLLEQPKRRTPLSDHLFETLRRPLHGVLPGKEEYEEAFHEFEYFHGVDSAHRLQRDGWGAMGRVIWAWRDGPWRGGRWESMVAEAKRHGQDWAPLQAGLFNGDLAVYLEIHEKYSELAKRAGRAW